MSDFVIDPNTLGVFTFLTKSKVLFQTWCQHSLSLNIDSSMSHLYECSWHIVGIFLVFYLQTISPQFLSIFPNYLIIHTSLMIFKLIAKKFSLSLSQREKGLFRGGKKGKETPLLFFLFLIFNFYVWSLIHEKLSYQIDL